MGTAGKLSSSADQAEQRLGAKQADEHRNPPQPRAKKARAAGMRADDATLQPRLACST